MSNRNFFAILSAGFLALGLALFAPFLNNPFVLDDMAKIQWNPDLHRPEFRVTDFFKAYSAAETNFRNDPSRPLTYIFYWLCEHTANGATWPFHLLNLLLHIGCAALIAFLMGKITAQQGSPLWRWAAVTAGGLFLTSPLITGTVLYAFGLSDILSAFWILLALAHSLRERRGLWLEAALFALALASKQSAIVLPALLLCVDLALKRRPRREDIILWLIALAYIISRFLIFGSVGDLEAHGDVYARQPYFFAQGLMILKYLQLALVPYGLTIDHFITPQTYSFAAQTVAWIVVIALTLASAFFFKIYRWSWCWLFYIIALLPTSSFFPTVDLLVERRAYLASAGLFCALGYLFLRTTRRLHARGLKYLLIALVILKIGSNSNTSYARGKTFSSLESIWSESLRIYPQSPRAKLNLATAESALKKYDVAKSLLESLLPQQPNNAALYSKLGFIYAQVDYSGRDDERALAAYQTSLTLDGDDIVTLLNAASLWLAHHDFANADLLLQHALALNPNMAYAHFVAAQSALQQGKTTQAEAQLETTLALNPEFQEAKQLLAVIRTSR